ncbi:O-antigen polysaccharide polymerase Wzy [Corynebacterium marinum]|uniref:O-antigen polysaccharide polymerase Wzy n=1 Tax=Corynebacterium marinum DSM 44953 TaxID=1224162 RepID=A0A0B6TXI2_9CORY|nr:O-antigen polysaccharide polymerase Wzy [Corynebacterium marinum]AJK69391.1 hypothetical protein B840_08990 [Corynebacterium marinum DSM 44953]
MIVDKHTKKPYTQKGVEGEGIRRQFAFALFLLHIVLLIVFSSGSLFEGADLQDVSRVAILTATLLYLAISFLYRERFWSVPSLTFLILALFHLGLFVTPAINGQLPTFVVDVGGSGTWFYSDATIIAVRYVLLGLVAYSAGLTLVFSLGVTATVSGEDNVSGSQDSVYRNNLALVGFVVLTVSTLTWLVISVYSGGPFFFLRSYGSYLAFTNDSALLNYTYIGISYGLLLSMFTRNHRVFAFSIGIFAVFGVCSLLLGMRDNVLIPAVAAAAMWAKFRGVRNSWIFVFGLIGVLSIVSLVRQLRKTGLGEFDFTGAILSPISAVEEMGFSLRVLHTTISWHEIRNEPFYGGVTYMAPFLRFVEGILGFNRLEGQPDYRLMNIEIGERVGQIGGSIIGEAHHNFGFLGIMCVLLAVGVLIGFLTLKARTALVLALLGVITVLFLMHVRNSFAPIPFWFGVGILFVGIAKLLSERQMKRAEIL